jgi:uncharacterized repeat protein (TIGR03803 family)
VQGYDPVGDLTFDQSGNIYGVAASYPGPGNVYELTASGNSYSILYPFTGGTDGGLPEAGVIFDASGNLYGTTWEGGANSAGAVYQLTPSGSGWQEQVLRSLSPGFEGDKVWAGVVMDSAGTLYGATSDGGPNGGGTVYYAAPSGGGYGGYFLYPFTGTATSGARGSLLMDQAGNLFGTTQGNPGAGDYGTVFVMTSTGGGWTYAQLYRFTGGSDGADPYSTPVLDTSGNLYGTTTAGGQQGYGTVFELTIGPLVAFNPTSLEFGRIVAKGHKTLTTTLTNTGYATLHITDITISGGNGAFSQTNNCSSSLGAGGSCTISVAFQPGYIGFYSGTLSVSDDAPDSPQQVPLGGAGTISCGSACYVSGECPDYCPLCNRRLCSKLDDPLTESLLDGNSAASSSCVGEPLSQPPSR